MRDKIIYRQMRCVFSNAPEYVFKELFYSDGGFFKNIFIELLEDNTDDEDIDAQFLEWSDLEWKNEIIEVSVEDFTPNTQKLFDKRKMGSVHLEGIPRDKERTRIQRKLAAKRTGGTNEPIVVLRKSNGYELMEGWHRTMSYLRITNDKVLLNAWVGTGDYVEELL